MHTPDKYDKQIAYLTEHPEKIFLYWVGGKGLFAFAGPISDPTIGCLTMIRGSGDVALTPELTKAIQSDERIPYGEEGITIESLPVFAEWQRRLDAGLNEDRTEVVDEKALFPDVI